MITALTKKQYDTNAKQYKTAEGMDEHEYLSKMKKTDKFLPVITIVIYYGEKPWDGAKSLHEMLTIPPKLKQYINNYTILLVEAREHQLLLRNKNNIDLFYLLNILLNQTASIQETKQAAINYANEQNVDASVIMAVAGATNCKLNYNALKKKGAINMCTVFEKTRMEGLAQGRAEGLTQGEAKGRKESAIEFIKNMFLNGIAIETIAVVSNKSVAEVKDILQDC